MPDEKLISFLPNYIRELALDAEIEITREEARKLHKAAVNMVRDPSIPHSQKEAKYLRALWDLLNVGRSFTPDPYKIYGYRPVIKD